MGQVKYYDFGSYWELSVDGTNTWVSLLAGEEHRPPAAGDSLRFSPGRWVDGSAF